MISDFFLALLLALIQGLTEFLPVSSSAHLLFPSLLFGAKDFGIVFDISVHAGTLAAVIYYFKNEIQGLLYAWMPWKKTRSKEDFSLGLNLLVATLPIVAVGLLASDLTETRSANIDSIAWANLVFAGLLYAAFKSSAQSKSLTEFCPLYKGSNDEVVTQYAMGSVEKLGLLKMDFLGLRTLTVINNTLKMIKQSKNIDLVQFSLCNK